MNNAIATRNPDRAVARLAGLAETLPAGEVARHRHARAQLIHALSGAMTVTTEAGRWVLPPNRALWVPPGQWHELSLRRPAELRTLYLAKNAPGLPDWRRCVVVPVPPLLRELLVAMTGEDWSRPLDAAAARRARVLLDQLTALPELPVHLPEPREPRAARMAALLREDLSGVRGLDALAAASGGSRRTMERVFAAETGLSLGAWRRQLRLLHALELLAAGMPVGDAAFAVGYQNPSSFILVFREAFGATPARWFAG